MALIETEAKEMGLDRLQLQATLTALPFYRARGFKESGQPLLKPINGVPIQCIPMQKDL